jgi:NitT/TauT family transport system substrate-binding protein
LIYNLTLVKLSDRIHKNDLAGCFGLTSQITKFEEEDKMRIRKFTQIALSLLILTVVVLGACTQTPETELPPQEPAAEEPAAEEPVVEEPAVGELTKIRLVALPVMELLPVYLAQQEGFFAENGVEVEVIPAASGQEKDQLLTVAAADCGQGEHLSLLLINQDEIVTQSVVGIYHPTESHPIMSIIAGANSGIENLEQLKGVEIATSEGTVSEYDAVGILRNNGFSDEDIKFLGVPRIPDRLALLESGELKAAQMPTHLGLMVVQTQGAKILADDGKYPGLLEASWVCRKEFIDENSDAIMGFVAAIGEAVEMINEDPQKYKGLAIENNMIPGPIIETYVMPGFPAPFVLSEETFKDIYQWAIERGLVSNENIAYEDIVRPEFIP